MASISITTKSPELVRILSRLENIATDAYLALQANAEDVTRQIDAIAQIEHERRARHAFAFAILSPQADFKPNVAAAPVLVDSLLKNDDKSTMYARLNEVGYYMLSDDKYRQYTSSRELILNAKPSDVNYPNVRKYLGFAQKTASMACALYDANLRVITNDTWMINGYLGEAKTGAKKNDNTYTLKGPSYEVVTEAILSIADDLNVSPFLLQWSLWTYYRGIESDNHLPIFEALG